MTGSRGHRRPAAAGRWTVLEPRQTLGLPGLLFALFLALPVVALILRALLGPALLEVVGRPVVVQALALSLVTTAASLAITVILGTPLAYLLARGNPTGRRLLESLVDLPIVLPPSVAGLALLLVFGRRGLLGEPLSALGLDVAFTTLAVVLAQTFVAAPFYVRAVRSGLMVVDEDLEDAARVDGAGEWAVLRQVTLPLAGPAIAAGLVMSWARALGEFGATIMFAGNVVGRTQSLPLLVYGEFQAGGLDEAIAAGAILVLAALAVLVTVRLLGRGALGESRLPS